MSEVSDEEVDLAYNCLNEAAKERGPEGRTNILLAGLIHAVLALVDATTHIAEAQINGR